MHHGMHSEMLCSGSHIAQPPRVTLLTAYGFSCLARVLHRSSALRYALVSYASAPRHVHSRVYAVWMDSQSDISWISVMIYQSENLRLSVFLAFTVQGMGYASLHPWPLRVGAWSWRGTPLYGYRLHQQGPTPDAR